MSSGKKEEKPTKQGKPFSVWFSIFMLLVSALVFLPTTILFVICMVPTLIAAIIDAHEPKTAWLTVGAMNFAGVVPCWFNLWESGHTVAAAFQTVLQPMTVIISYGGAAAGWFIYNNVPPFVANIILKKSEKRLRDIDRRQKDLVKKWGESVISGAK